MQIDGNPLDPRPYSLTGSVIKPKKQKFMKKITAAITLLSILLLHISVSRADEIPQSGSQDRQDGPRENTVIEPEIRPFQLSLVPFIGTEGAYAAENI